MFKKALIVALIWAGLGACLSFGQSYIIPNESSSPTWTGVHTFVQSPLVPDPFTAFQAANKEYVDAHGGGGGPCSTSGAVKVSTIPCDPNITINSTNHTFNLGPQPNAAAPSGAYENYSGLPDVLNVMTDCPAITGLAVVGDGSTDDSTAIQQCMWQRMGICPTIGTACTSPADRRYPSSTGVNSTGVTFVFPQRSFTKGYGAGCSYYFSVALDVPWGVHMEGVGAGAGESATQLCFADGQDGLMLRGYDVVKHFAVFSKGTGFGPFNTAQFILPVGWGGSGTGDGILVGVRTSIEDVYIRYFGGHGLRCDSTAAWPGIPATNSCDNGDYSHIQSENNRGHGFYFFGIDANVGTCTGCTAVGNQLYGLWSFPLYPTVFNSFLGDANHQDGTTYIGTIPSITAVSCSATLGCTFTTGSSSPGTIIGDLVRIGNCNDTTINLSGQTVTAVGSTSFTVGGLISPYAPDSPTGCTAAWAVGTHIWAAAGNTVMGENADGGCMYAPIGTFVLPYCEGDQAPGSATGANSFMINPQAYAQTSVTSDNYLGSYSGGIVGSSYWSMSWNSTISEHLAFNDGFGPVGANVFTQIPGTIIGQENAPTTIAVKDRPLTATFGNFTQMWDCDGLPGSYSTVNMNPLGVCYPVTMEGSVQTCTVTAPGSGYTTPFTTVTSIYGGTGATITLATSGGAVTGCTVTANGWGYGLFPAVTVYDSLGGSGTGARVTATSSSMNGTNVQRSALNGLGGAWFPNWLCLGFTGSGTTPRACWTYGTAAPTSGSWKIGDMVINSAYAGGTGTWAWENTAAGTPGTWVALQFGGGGGGGFPIVLGSTSIAASSTTTAVAGLSVNGVTLDSAGSSTLFLNQAGGYTAPGGGSVGTAGQVQMVGSTSGSFAASSATDNGTNYTITEPVVINASGNGIAAVEGTAPSGVPLSDLLWPDSTAHRWKMNNNNAGALNIPGIASAAVAGDAATFASNGIDLVDGGALPVINAGLIGYGAYYPATGSALSQDSNFGHFNTTAVIADTDGASATQFSASGSGNGQVVSNDVANCSSTGTTLNFLAKIIDNGSGTACAVLTTTSDVNVSSYAETATLPVNGALPCAAGTTGQSCLVIRGAATLTVDSGGATDQHYAGSSPTGASGTVTDLGTGTGLLTVNCVGRFLATAAGGATVKVMTGDCPTYPGTTGVNTFNTQTGAVTLASSGGSINITNTGAAFNIDTVPTAARLEVPGWLRFLGNGADGAFTCTTGTCALGAGEHWYTSFNVSSGAIAAVTASGGEVVRATGTCTIAGTVSVSGNTGSGAGSGANGGWYGGTGGGGGFGASNGTAAASEQSNVGTVLGGAAGTSGVSGGGGNTPTTIIQRGWLSGGWPTGSYTSQAFYYGGTAGGAGQGNAGSGGKGGGMFVLVCGTINFTGTIDASGVNGVAGGSSTGGGGGGGGGGVIEAAITYTANTGTINLAGGLAGAIGTGTSTAGGAGNTGVSASFTF